MKKFLLFILLCLTPCVVYANYIMYAAPISGTATTASAQIYPQNSLRTYLIIVNTSSTVTLYVKTGSTQTGAQGIPIPPGGNWEPFKAPSNSVYVDTASSTATYVAQQGQ